jgi:hypothetical protein
MADATDTTQAQLMDDRFNHRVSLITGAASGIGRAMAMAFGPVSSGARGGSTGYRSLVLPEAERRSTSPYPLARPPASVPVSLS